MLILLADAFASDLPARLKPFGEVHATTWKLGPRPADTAPPAPTSPPPPTKATATGGIYSVEATARVAQPLSSPEAEEAGGRDPYFDDLAPELRKVLAAQLKQAGDVSAVIEMPAGFVVFAATAVTPESLSAVSLSLPKRNYDEWLNQQPNR